MSSKGSSHGKAKGPTPDTLRLDGDWEDRVRDALAIKKPAGGWPKPERKTRKTKGRKGA